MTILRRLPPSVRFRLSAAMRWTRAAALELGTIGPADPAGQAFGFLGDGAALLWPQGTIYNERYLSIGAGTMVGPNVCLTAGMHPDQEMVTNPVVKIGERCLIGRGSHLVGHFSIELGDDIQTGPYVYITDQNHVYEDPDQPIGQQWPVEAPVRIGSGSWLGANVVVLPGTTIGEHCVVAAGAVVRGTIPDHSVVAGVPAKVVRRWTRGDGWQPVAHS